MTIVSAMGAQWYWRYHQFSPRRFTQVSTYAFPAAW
jgi:hypothetical protein